MEPMLKSIDTLIGFALIMTLVSLLITIVVQMISAAMNMRGNHLLKGLSLTLDTVSPGATKTIDRQAKALAEHILKLPQLNDHANDREASAIRASEVFSTLVEMARGGSVTSSQFQEQARKVLRMAGVPESVFTGIDDSEKVLEDVKRILQPDPAHPNPLVQQLEAARAAFASTANQTLAEATAATGAAWKRFEFWFEATQDRAQQWFAAQTRSWTIFFSFVAAFGLQLDTVEIYRKVSQDSVLREKLVASANSINTVAEKTLDDSASVITAAWDGWMKDAKTQGSQTDALFSKLDKSAQDALSALKPAQGDTRGSFLANIRSKLVNAPQAEEVEASFTAQLDKTANARLIEKSGDFKKVQAALTESGFDLAPPKGFFRWKDECCGGFPSHLLGMLITAGLLTLGAPFWFNTLRTLTNLRSVVAKDISKEEEKKQTNNGQAHPPPAEAH